LNGRIFNFFFCGPGRDLIAARFGPPAAAANCFLVGRLWFVNGKDGDGVDTTAAGVGVIRSGCGVEDLDETADVGGVNSPGCGVDDVDGVDSPGSGFANSSVGVDNANSSGGGVVDSSPAWKVCTLHKLSPVGLD